jgi:hypothetical protein
MILDRFGNGACYPSIVCETVLWIFFAVSKGSFLSSLLVKEMHGSEGR